MMIGVYLMGENVTEDDGSGREILSRLTVRSASNHVGRDGKRTVLRRCFRDRILGKR